MASLREVLASFTVDMAPAAKELALGSSLVDGLVGKLKGLGGALLAGFAVDTVLGKFNELLQEADQLAKASQGLGLETAELQELEHAAGLSGVSVGALRAALQRLQRTAADAASGGGKGGEAFKKMGIELKNADGTIKTSGQIFEEAATAIAGIENPTERAGVASKLFGKSYAQLIPLLAEGGDGLRKLRAEVGELGFAFDEAFLENAQEYNDNIDRFKAGLKGLYISAIGPLLPRMVQFSQSLVEGTKKFVAMFKQSKILEAAFGTLGVLGFSKLIGLVGGLRAAVGKLIPFLWRTVAPLLAVEDVLVFLAGGESVLGDMIDGAFGDGSQQKVRDFIEATKRGFAEMLETARTNNAAFRRDWNATLADAREEFRGTFGGGFLGEVLAAGLDAFFVFVNGASNGLRGLLDTAIGILRAINFNLHVVGEDMRHIFYVAVSHVQDLFARLWNSIGEGAQRTASVLETILSKIPGMGGIAKDIGEAIRMTGELSVFGDKFSADNVEKELARHKAVGEEILAYGEEIESQLRGPGREERALAKARRNFRATPTEQPFRFDLANGATAVSAPAAPVTNIKQEVSAPIRVQNTFVVPAGTEIDQQRAIGAAATKGTTKAVNTEALRAALVPAPG